MLKILPLGGAGEVTKNMFLYETERNILVVDCGAGFPEEEIETSNLTIPDFSYLRNTQKNLCGAVITHAHFDHYGALPYFLDEFNLPVYSSRLVIGFVKQKLEEKGKKNLANLHLIQPGQKITLADFRITPFLVNHSVPDSFGLSLSTPEGNFFHVSDFKFDLTPVDNKVFDFSKCLELAKGGVTALFSDCLGALEPGFTQTESQIEENLVQIIKSAPSQVFVTTISSNLSRIKQIINAASKLGRRVVILGRSIEKSIKIADQLNYLPKIKRKVTFLEEFKKRKMPEERRLLYLAAGSYGQLNSALTRISENQYPPTSLKKGAVVIFSADPSPPKTRDKVDDLVDKLTLKGARVFYYDLQENLHVSGHGSSEDLKLLIALVKPKFVVPIGGNPRHLRAYRFLAYQMKMSQNQVLEILSGEPVIFLKEKIKIGPRIPLKEILVEQEE